ncbi:hypothetical protein BDN70DRAFT_939466 [Pholiota conissans]|uniref:Uncharacterized protein n=1 Tax=Pholiota conissans TaxID=109636 RepID=A0A9P6CR20_9AGAR|nr:hypothetical protein BDN70DRAFT_939466 [Pholiota conissans]
MDDRENDRRVDPGAGERAASSVRNATRLSPSLLLSPLSLSPLFSGREISSPSLTQMTAPEPSKLDTSPVFVSVQGSSTLQAPQISITKATPEPSPTTTTGRRGHHKSTLTMPTSSVLKASVVKQSIAIITSLWPPSSTFYKPRIQF